MTKNTDALAWERFSKALDGDDFAIPGKDKDLLSYPGEEPTMLSSALTKLYQGLINPVPNTLKAVLDHPCAHRRFADITRINSHIVKVKFKSNWFPLVTLSACSFAIAGEIETMPSRPFYRHITHFRREDLGDNWQHINLKKIIHHELDLLFAEEHHWSAGFRKNIGTAT